MLLNAVLKPSIPAAVQRHQAVESLPSAVLDRTLLLLQGLGRDASAETKAAAIPEASRL